MNDNIEKTTFVSGNFNILHPGHLRLFRFAKELGGKLIVCVTSDRLAGSAALVPEQLRLEALQSNTWIDDVFLIDEPVSDVIRRLKPDIVVKGKEHEGQLNPEEAAVSDYGGKLVFSSGEAVFSSFDLIQRELQKNRLLFTEIPKVYFKYHSLNLANLTNSLANFKNLHVLVLGDLIVDEYITCDPLGMSQEDPTIVVTPIESKVYIGGAGIVAAHAAGLGAKVSFLSVAGNDATKEIALSKLNEFNVAATLFEDESRPTTLKQRYRSKGKTLLRVSHLHQGAVNANIQAQFLNKVKELLETIDLLIFSDFNYGCLPTEMVNKIIALAKQKNIFMVADSQSSSQIGDIGRFKNMSLLTPTEREARLSVRDSESGLVVLAEKLRKQAEAGNILLKIGEEGVLIHAETKAGESWLTDRIPALNPIAVDVAGAGDSMLVASAMCLACKASIWEAAVIGSIAAAIQVSRVGNIPIQSKELFAAISTLK
jgi:rfaE bifunctional protein kinase chain/domain